MENEMRIRDLSSDVCSSDLHSISEIAVQLQLEPSGRWTTSGHSISEIAVQLQRGSIRIAASAGHSISDIAVQLQLDRGGTHLAQVIAFQKSRRSEEHTSELQSLMRISYAVFC